MNLTMIMLYMKQHRVPIFNVSLNWDASESSRNFTHAKLCDLYFTRSQKCYVGYIVGSTIHILCNSSPIVVFATWFLFLFLAYNEPRIPPSTVHSILGNLFKNLRIFCAPSCNWFDLVNFNRCHTWTRTTTIWH